MASKPRVIILAEPDSDVVVLEVHSRGKAHVFHFAEEDAEWIADGIVKAVWVLRDRRWRTDGE